MANEFLIPGYPMIWLARNTGQPATSAVTLAYQNDAGPLYLAVADTNIGRIPGKAMKGTCWYSINGKEEETAAFWWICASSQLKLYRGDFPRGPLASGYQHDGSGLYYSVVADTSYGTIPGKICASSRLCSYPYGGKEHTTDNFSYVIFV
ncbi:uncharacterized protein LOC141902760 [Tubulanus polymorphus]|uniref:uncharacterized protein LOC141902760 n=1 Tax=Tubulanus polymorphus TaxID=672921 RepID=UPI003DA5203C